MNEENSGPSNNFYNNLQKRIGGQLNKDFITLFKRMMDPTTTLSKSTFICAYNLLSRMFRLTNIKVEANLKKKTCTSKQNTSLTDELCLLLL